MMPTSGRVSGRRRRRKLHAFVEPHYFRGVCGAHGSMEQDLLNFSSWRRDCSHKTHAGAPICYLVDRDPGNDVEPWQEIENVLFERWLKSSTNCNRPDLVADLLDIVLDIVNLEVLVVAVLISPTIPGLLFSLPTLPWNLSQARSASFLHACAKLTH